MFTLNYVRYGEPRYGADLVIALLALKQLEVLDVRVDALIGDGLLSEEPVCAEHGMFVYDALYAWCARQVETTPAT